MKVPLTFNFSSNLVRSRCISQAEVPWHEAREIWEEWYSRWVKLNTGVGNLKETMARKRSIEDMAVTSCRVIEDVKMKERERNSSKQITTIQSNQICRPAACITCCLQHWTASCTDRRWGRQQEGSSLHPSLAFNANTNTASLIASRNQITKANDTGNFFSASPSSNPFSSTLVVTHHWWVMMRHDQDVGNQQYVPCFERTGELFSITMIMCCPLFTDDAFYFSRKGYQIVN